MNRNTVYPYQGQHLPLKAIAAKHGIYPKTLLYRIKVWGSVERAVSEPVLPRGVRSAKSYRSRYAINARSS